MTSLGTAEVQPLDLSDVERRALDTIDPDEIRSELVTLIGIPSVGGSDAECEIQHVLARRLDECGLEVDLWQADLDSLRSDRAFPGEEVERSEAWGLVATSGPGVPALVLQGHVDVVPPGDLDRWRGDPYVARVADTRVQGRGACDMKAGLVANLAAVRAVQRVGLPSARPIGLHFAIGEEDGGLGAFATLRRGHVADACIITEPTSGGIVTAAGGALTFEIRVGGVASHGSTAYAGRSALHHFVPLLTALGDLERRRNESVDPLMAGLPVAYPISVGRVRCGDWASSVPDLLVAEGRLGVALDEDPAQARAALEEAIRVTARGNTWLRHHPPTVSWTGGQYASGRLVDGASLLGLLGSSLDAVGATTPRQPRGVPYGSDLRLYSGEGVPTLHYGPGDAQVAHSPREEVDLREVVQVAQTLTVALLRAAGGVDGPVAS
ncbi:MULTISPECIES: ArgE/DapE family deacylase [unclassified Knoellia]|uniref:ArgE/DapE family deacylase n=1 Tax=Knoellia altitudinis TaxID=3404795 RepID=UPI00360D66EB